MVIMTVQDRDPLDEIGCQCDSQVEVANMTQCKSKITKSGLKLCSHFLQAVNNSCHVYQNVYNFINSHFPHKSMNPEILQKLSFVDKIKPYKCANALRINFSMVNDLVPDCGPDAEDEQFLKNVKQNKLYTCLNKNQIPCRIGHPKCFNIFDICTYRLDEMNHLIPCRTGEHLQNCRKFECNMLFKCPSSHCIPWVYVCDSKWDCPGGFDELEHICGSKRQCHNMYKCTQSQICIHLNDVCNSFTDCPHKDDEKYCSLSRISCPLNCQCLTFAIHCKELNLTIDGLGQSLPFHVISIKGSLNYTTLHFLKLLKFVTILILVKNDLEELCGKLPPFRYCFVLDISFNNIQMINSHCFTNAYFLRVVRLNNNKLSVIFPHAFVNLTSLYLLDLSQNLLHTFTFNMFINSNVRELSLLNNDIKIADFNNLGLDILKINDYRPCCLMTTVMCSAEIPWYIPCADLLGNVNIKVFLYFMSSSIIILNIFTLFIRTIFRSKQFGAFYITVMPIILTDLMYGLPLFVLCVTDSYFHGQLILHEIEWKSSSICLAMFTTVLYFNLFSSFLLSFLSLQRFMIVIYPLMTKFKEIKFVKKCMFLAFITTFSLSLGIALFTRYYYTLMPFHLCFPFLDPTKSVFAINIFTWMTFIIHVIAMIFMVTVHRLTLKGLHDANKNLNIRLSRKISYLAINIQLIVFITSSIICWIASDITYISCIFLERYSIEMIIWIVAAISPINSLINPVMFTIMKFRE